MGVQGGTEERKDWSEAEEPSFLKGQVEQVVQNEFHGRPKDIPVRTGRKQAEEQRILRGRRPGLCFQLELFLAPVPVFACKR